MITSQQPALIHSELLQLKRFNTPTVYNGWEQITRHNPVTEAINQEETHDFMPHMGPVVGYAITVVIEPGNPDHPTSNPYAWKQYREYVASQTGPKIVVVQDLNKPKVLGAFWGEVNSSVHRALGCVGTITDGGIRDLDEMNAVGFKAIARRLCVAHAYSWPIRWGCDVEVFGQTIHPGQLMHADKHGFIAIPFGEETGLLDSARFMDVNESNTLLAAAQSTENVDSSVVLSRIEEAVGKFSEKASERFSRRGEW